MAFRMFISAVFLAGVLVGLMVAAWLYRAIAGLNAKLEAILALLALKHGVAQKPDTGTGETPPIRGSGRADARS